MTRSAWTAMALALVALVGGIGAGMVIERHRTPSSGADVGGDDGPRILYWVAPMDPNYRRDGPGKSPMGMDLIPVYEGEESAGGGNDDVVALSPSMVQTINVRTASVERIALRPSIETFGSVAYDERRTSHVHVRAEGWVETLHVRAIGDPVREGQPLFEVFSPELATAAWEYVRDLENPQSRLRAGSRAKLLALGVDPRQVAEITASRVVPERVHVYAPRSGVVIELNVADNMFLTPAMTAMSITDLSSVWLLADVFESQAAFVGEGMDAHVRVAGMPTASWHGVVDYVYPELRPETRTVRVRISIANPDRTLKPNMFASVSLLAPPTAPVLTVPDTAVIRTGRSERLILALGNGRFRAVPVRLGRSAADRVEVLDGVSEGDRVVVSSHFLIDSASNLDAAFRQLEEGEAPPTTSASPPTAAEGRVETVDLVAGTATITHAPIPALGWPAMTMPFALAPDLDPAALRPGAAVRFEFVASGTGSFTVVAARPPDPDAPEAWTEAMINGPAVDGRINVTHAPIPALGWPAMTMDLTIADTVSADSLPPGGRVRIGIAKGPDGLYRIVAATPADGS